MQYKSQILHPFVAIFLVSLIAGASAAQANADYALPCDAPPAAWEKMGHGAMIVDGDFETGHVPVHVADTNATRSQGFQEACDEAFGSMVILFDMGYDANVSFHMQNVSQPLAIAFVDRHGHVNEVQTMDPDTSGHGPSEGAYRFAVEASPEHMDALGIEQGTQLDFIYATH